MRIYIGNVEIAGYFLRLKEGFDKEGVKADLWFLSKNKYYNVKMPLLVRLNQFLFSAYKRKYANFDFIIKLLLAPLVILLKALIFVFVMFRYDVFILNSHAFFNFYELPILKYFGKKIIFVCLGTESRPLYLSGNFILSRYVKGQGYDYERCFKEVKKQYEEISRIEKYADYIINHPPTALFHKKPFISWLHIGFPFEAKDTPFQKLREVSRIVKVLHAPSNGFSKGSAEIEAIVKKLEREGYPVEFVKLHNVPNEKVIRAIEECDIVIDEIYSDIPLGGLGTEAAVAQKPVINAGYYASQIKEDYPDSVIPPSCFCHPDLIESELVDMLNNRNQRLQVAENTHRFIKENWGGNAIAKKFMRIINKDVPPSWFYPSGQMQYIRGYGIHEERLKSFLLGYIKAKGVQALFLDENLKVRSKLLEFIYE